MEMCARCKKKPAMVYIMKIENGEQQQEGHCLACAKELGIKPVNDIMTKMGISEDELDEMEKMMAEVFPTDEDGDEDAPTIDFSKLMRNTSMGQAPEKSDRKDSKEKSKKGGAKNAKEERKHLTTFCSRETYPVRFALASRVIYASLGTVSLSLFLTAVSLMLSR